MLGCHPLCDSRRSSGSAHKKSSSDRFDGAMVGSDCYITPYNDQSPALANTDCRDCCLRRSYSPTLQPHPMPPKKRQRKPKQQAAMPAMPAPKMPTRRRTATRRSHDIPTDEERSAASTPSPSPSTSRHHKLQEDQQNLPPPSSRKNVGDLPTFFSTSRLPTSFADNAKTLADSQKTRIPSLREKQILPWYNTNPEDYPMPTITMIPGPGEVALCRSLEKKMGKAIPAHVTRGGTRVHFNPASEAEYYLIWDHLIEHNAEIIRPENHQMALQRRPQIQSTSAPHASSTPTPTQSATTSRDVTPQRSPTPSMSANTPCSGSPSRSPTPCLSANTPRSGSPRHSPDASPERSWTPPRTPERTPTPKMSPNPSRDASPTQTKMSSQPAMTPHDRTTPAPATIQMDATTSAHTAQRTTPTPAATQMVDDSEPTAQNSLMAAANNQTTRRPVPSPRVRRHSENDTTKRHKRRKHKASRQPVPPKDATHSASATAQLQSNIQCNYILLTQYKIPNIPAFLDYLVEDKGSKNDSEILDITEAVFQQFVINRYKLV
ncbi:hypothetical protein ACJJTC_005562 [Scirpophaga incertulas]